ncbi:restriction endonuclease subunit S [Halopseudomonas maritima]|uniref:restriction endonuclease subunit S n=1 Tax=Halopseudomonas maritima TaxID=2918528 RepID=UPI001EEC5E11|nr:restriction endonuclease subunit S [Halopseudomonas maritima]UJJ32777.1 restriction endonuclease subunit S [Halopseudomonas maritima]
MSELPSGWTDVEIGEIADVVAGGTPKANDSSNFEAPGAGIAWLTPADLSGYNAKEISHGSRDLSQKGYESCSAKLMPKGSLLFSSRAPIGYVALAANEISTNQGFKSFVFPEEIDPSYAFYYLKSIRQLADSLGTGTTFKELSGTTAKTLPFRMAPEKEQTRIAAKLDELLAQADTLKARIDGIPALLKRFRQSVLAAAVSGRLTEEWRKLANGAQEFVEAPFETLIHEMRNGLSAKPNEDQTGLPILRISAVRPMSVDYSDHRFLVCSGAEAARYRLREDDLLFTRYNGSLELVGVCGMIKKQPNPEIVYPDKLIRVRCNTSMVLPSYIELFFAQDSIRQRVMELVKSTSGQKGISGKDLKAFPVSFPQLEEQTEIVRRVEQLFAFADQLEARVAAAQERVDKLTQSILAKAFRGELVPQDPNDEPASVLLERIKAQRAAAPKAKRGRKAKA